MTKYNIVSGWNRGGTSALMFALRQAGIPIIGFAYPIRLQLTSEEDKRAKLNIESFTLIPEKEKKDNNKNGFWEIPSICLENGLKEKYENIGVKGDLIKVPLDVLPGSSPKLVDKVVIILREPGRVISSQIWCKKIKHEEEYIRLASLGLMHNLLVSLNWLKQNKIKYRIMYYEDLLEDPYNELAEVCDFFNRGTPWLGAETINKGFNKAKPVESGCKEFKMINELYSSIKERKSLAKHDVKKIEKEFVRLGKKSKELIK